MPYAILKVEESERSIVADLILPEQLAKDGLQVKRFTYKEIKSMIRCYPKEHMTSVLKIALLNHLAKKGFYLATCRNAASRYKSRIATDFYLDIGEDYEDIWK